MKTHMPTKNHMKSDYYRIPLTKKSASTTMNIDMFSLTRNEQTEQCGQRSNKRKKNIKDKNKNKI